MLWLITVAGTIGYRQLMHWSLLDSLYMTVITIGTVGFREVAPLSAEAKVFTIMLIFGGLAVGGYAIGNIAAFFAEGQLKYLLKGGRMAWEITNLKNHVIVCGYGKIGREVCASLAAADVPFIVIDIDENKIDEAIELGYLAVIGNASDDEVLLKVGIQHARALVSAVTDDTENVYLVLTARSLNDKLFIIARAADDAACKKLKRVGADQVVSPYEIGGRRMATYLLKADVVDFVDAFMNTGGTEVMAERVAVSAASSIVGKSLRESNIRNTTGGAMIIGIEENGKLEINPSADTLLQSGQVLLALGTREQLEALRKAINP